MWVVGGTKNKFKSFFSSQNCLEFGIISEIINRLFDFYSFPESDHSLNVVCSGFRCRLEPSSIRILFAIDDNVVVVAFTFPGTGRGLVLFTWLEVLLLQGIRWEVMIVFDNHSSV